MTAAGFINSSPGPADRPLALLVFPPIYDFALYDLFLKPYSLLRLGAWLVEAGYRVALINALDYRDPLSLKILGRPKRSSRGTGKFFRQILPQKPGVFSGPDLGLKRHYARYGMVRQSLAARIGALQPDIVFVASGMTYWYPGVVEAVRILRRCHPRVPIVLGGIYATLCPEHARSRIEADFVVAGPALPRLREILSRLSLPFSREELPEELLLFPEAMLEAGVIRINRGCPFHCSYCSAHILEPEFNIGNPEASLINVQKMNKIHGTSNFAFYDDALLVGKERGIIPFLQRIIASTRGLSFYLPNGVHLKLLDPGLAKLMRRAGFREIRLGFESALPQFHDHLDGKLSPDMLGEKINLLRAAGFSQRQLGVYVLAGLPGQRATEVESSIRYAAAQGVRVSVAEYSPVPGSPLWERSVAASPFPLKEEPLTHNNSIFPQRWSAFTLQQLQELKRLARTLEG